MDEERRIALLPDDIARCIENPQFLYFERGYGRKYDISDSDYRGTGAHVVTAERAYSLDVICQPKFCEEDASELHTGQTVFGWLHLHEGDDISEKLIKKATTAIAWENMANDDGKVFSENNFLTGRIGVLNAVAYAGKVPEECSVAIIGRGNVGKGARFQLEQLGVTEIAVYHRRNSHLLKKHIGRYDIIVHCAQCYRRDFIKRKDLRRMKQGALLIHLGADNIEGILSSSSMYSPIEEINKGRNGAYCFNHVPTLAYKTATRQISRCVALYINQLVNEEMDRTLSEAVVIDRGEPLKDRW